MQTITTSLEKQFSVSKPAFFVAETDYLRLRSYCFHTAYTGIVCPCKVYIVAAKEEVLSPLIIATTYPLLASSSFVIIVDKGRSIPINNGNLSLSGAASIVQQLLSLRC